MNKKIGFVFIVFGIILSVLSMIFFHGITDDGSNNLFNTSKVHGDELNADKYKDYNYSKSFDISYLKSHNTDSKNVVYFPIMNNEIYKNTSSEFTSYYNYEDISISAYIVEKNDINSYIDFIISDYDADQTLKFNYNKGVFNINNQDVSYLKLSYISDEKYVDNFYFFVKTCENEFAVINYFSDNKKLTDEFMTKIAKEIRKEDNKGNYLITTLKDGYLCGTLVGFLEDKNINPRLNISVDSTKYEEIIDGNNTTNHLTLKRKDDSAIITYEFLVQETDDILMELTDLIMSKYEDTDGLKANDLSNKIDKIGDREFSIVSFNYDESNNTKYSKVYIEKLDENIVCIVTITSSKDETIINELYNYKYEF